MLRAGDTFRAQPFSTAVLLAAGPWLPLQLPGATPAPEQPTIAATAARELQELDANNSIIDVFLNPAIDALSDGGERIADQVAQVAAWGVNNESTREWDTGLDIALFYVPILDAKADQMERDVPPETYLPVPGEAPPYDSRQTFTTENPTGPEPEPGQPTPEPIIHYDAEVFIENISKPGKTDFSVGDTFKLTVRGAANSRVSVEAKQNSVDRPSQIMGNTNASGEWVALGLMDAPSRGLWMEKWFVNETVCHPILFFAVN